MISRVDARKVGASCRAAAAGDGGGRGTGDRTFGVARRTARERQDGL